LHKADKIRLSKAQSAVYYGTRRHSIKEDTEALPDALERTNKVSAANGAS
jgi:hypothetical protein